MVVGIESSCLGKIELRWGQRCYIMIFHGHSDNVVRVVVAGLLDVVRVNILSYRVNR